MTNNDSLVSRVVSECWAEEDFVGCSRFFCGPALSWFSRGYDALIPFSKMCVLIHNEGERATHEKMVMCEYDLQQAVFYMYDTTTVKI